MPRDSEGKPVLNKPFKSTVKGKKFSVYVMKDGKVKKINFGATGYPDFRSGTATKEQRNSYLARAKGIKNKAGQLTWKDKTSPNYWSIRYLWKG
tara:strand:- start:38 stop:319 length:282 start_codon:yes stop_codon:yes gene_type:complete